MEASGVLADLLNIIPVLPYNSLEIAVSTVLELLLSHIASNSTPGATNPLVAILNSRGDAWLCMITALTRSISKVEFPPDNMHFFVPVLTYLLLQQPQHCRAYVHTQLTALGRRATSTQVLRIFIFRFLTSLVPHYKADTVDSAAYILNACEEIIELSEVIGATNKEFHKHSLFHGGISIGVMLVQVCFSLHEAGRNTLSALLLLKRLSETEPVFLSSPPLVSAALIALLPTAASEEQTIILDLLATSLEFIQTKESYFQHENLFLLHTLPYPLLQLISGINVLLQEKAAKLLHKAEIMATKMAPLVGSQPTLKYGVGKCAVVGQLLLLHKSWSLASSMWAGDSSLSIDWLKAFATRLQGMENGSSWRHTMLLISPFLGHSAPHIRIAAASIFPVLSRIKGATFQVLSCLPMLTYRLMKEVCITTQKETHIQ